MSRTLAGRGRRATGAGDPRSRRGRCRPRPARWAPRGGHRREERRKIHFARGAWHELRGSRRKPKQPRATMRCARPKGLAGPHPVALIAAASRKTPPVAVAAPTIDQKCVRSTRAPHRQSAPKSNRAPVLQLFSKERVPTAKRDEQQPRTTGRPCQRAPRRRRRPRSAAAQLAAADDGRARPASAGQRRRRRRAARAEGAVAAQPAAASRRRGRRRVEQLARARAVAHERPWAGSPSGRRPATAPTRAPRVAAAAARPLKAAARRRPGGAVGGAVRAVGGAGNAAVVAAGLALNTSVKRG